MRTLLCTLLALLLVLGSASAQGPRPRTDDHGVYAANTWRYWQASARQGVIVRTSPDLARLLATPRAQWNEVDPSSWAPTWRLPFGYVAIARVVQGSTIWVDARGTAWIILELGAGRTGLAPATSRDFFDVDDEPVRADAAGRYRATTHRFWQVVDADSKGLNARQHPRFPRDYDSVDAVWPTTPVRSWPVVATIPRHTVLEAAQGNRGVITMHDPDGAAWLLVTLPSASGRRAFVRWNARFVTPVAGPLQPISGR